MLTNVIVVRLGTRAKTKNGVRNNLGLKTDKNEKEPTFAGN